MPRSKKTVQASQAPVVPTTPVVPAAAPTPVDAAAPPVAADNKKAAHLQRLQNQLNHNASFMRMMGWTVGILAAVMSVPYVTAIVEAFIWPIMKLPFWYFGLANWPLGTAGPLTNVVTSFIFGTQTTSGLPIALVKGLLPAFMAPAAVWVAFGVPLLLMAYQYAYVNWNENLFAPKPSAEALERDRKKNTLEAEESPEPKQELESSKNNKQTPSTVVEPQNPTQAKREPSSAPVPAKKAVQQGSANPILSHFTSRTQAQKEARAKVAAVKKKAAKAPKTTKPAPKKRTRRKIK